VERVCLLQVCVVWEYETCVKTTLSVWISVCVVFFLCLSRPAFFSLSLIVPSLSHVGFVRSWSCRVADCSGEVCLLVPHLCL